MKLLWILVILALASECVLCKRRGPKPKPRPKPTKQPKKIDEERAPGSKLISDFLLDLSVTYREANLLYSPIGLQWVLGMALLGAAGNTSEQIQSVIGPADQIPLIDDKTVLVANKAYARSEYKIKDAYKTAITEKLKAEVENVDFADANATATAINAWVEEKTNKKITGLEVEDYINENSSVILVNAMNFNAKWATAFEKTDKMPFNNANETVVNVPMMKRTASTPYAKLDNLVAIKIECTDTKISMLIVLPNEEVVSGNQTEDKKDPTLNEIIAGLQPTDITLTMPILDLKFRISIKEQLNGIGIKQAFNTEKADFSGMITDSADADVPVVLSDVVHKAVLNINEMGADVSSGTPVQVNKRAPLQDATEVVINRPFDILIINEADSLPLLVGVIRNLKEPKE